MDIKIEDIVELIKEKKGENILGINVKGISSITDYVLIASGNNARQVVSIADNIVEKTEVRPINKDGYDEGKWIILDYGDIMVHIFEKEERDHYKIEKLWLDSDVDYFNEEEI